MALRASKAAELLVEVKADVDRAHRDLTRLDKRVRSFATNLRPAATAAKAFGVAALAGFATLGTQAVLGSVIQFTAALAPMAGALAAFPALILAAVTAFATLKIGLSGVGDAMKTLGGTAEEFAEGIKGLAPAAQDFMRALRGMREEAGRLKTAVQDALFTGMADTVKELGRAYLPMLTTELSTVARTFANVGNNLGRFLSLPSTVADVQQAIRNTNPLVAGLGEGVKDVLAAFLDLSVGASGSMVSLGQAIANTTQRFRDWAREARESGKVREWISEAATAFREFGQILGNVGGILRGVFSAGDGGSGLLLNLVNITQRVEDFVKSTQGQEGLDRFFRAASDAVSALAGPLGAAFTALTQVAKVVSEIAKGVGPGLKDFLQALGVQFGGLAGDGRNLGESMGTFLRSLIPVLPVVADLVRKIVNLAGAIAPFGPQIAALAGGFVALKVALTITSTLSAVAGGLGAIAGGAANAARGTANLYAGLTQAGAGASAFTGRMGTVGGAIRNSVAAFGRGAWAALGWAEKVILAAGRAVASFVAATARMIAAATAWAARMVAAGARAAAAFAASAARMVASLAVTAAGFIAQGAVMLASFAVTVATVVAGWVLMGTQALIQAARMAAAWLIAMGPVGWAIAAIIGLAALIYLKWDEIVAFTKAAWARWGDEIKAALGLVVQVITLNLRIAWEIIKGVWDIIVNTTRVTWQTLVGAVQIGVNMLRQIVTGLKDSVVSIVRGLWNIVSGIFTGDTQRIVAGVKQVFGGLIGFMSTIPRAIVGALGNLGSLLYGAGRSILQGLVNGIKSMAGGVVGAVKGVLQSARNLLPFSPAKTGPFSGKGWTLYSGRAIGAALAKGLTDTKRTVASAAAGMAAAAHPDLAGVSVPGASVGPSRAAQRARAEGITPDAVRQGAGARTTVFQFQTYNPVAEAQSITTNRALARAGSLGLV